MKGAICLLRDEEVREYLRSLKECPFCGNEILTRAEFYGDYVIACAGCDFRLSSTSLFQSSQVKEEMKTVSHVLRKPIQKEIKKYEEELRDKIVATSLFLESLKRRLESHRKKS